MTIDDNAPPDPGPAPTDLRLVLEGISRRHQVVVIGLSNGMTRRGRIAGMLDNCIQLNPEPPSKQLRTIAMAHIVTVEVE